MATAVTAAVPMSVTMSMSVTTMVAMSEAQMNARPIAIVIAIVIVVATVAAPPVAVTPAPVMNLLDLTIDGGISALHYTECSAEGRCACRANHYSCQAGSYCGKSEKASSSVHSKVSRFFARVAMRERCKFKGAIERKAFAAGRPALRADGIA